MIKKKSTTKVVTPGQRPEVVVAQNTVDIKPESSSEKFALTNIPARVWPWVAVGGGVIILIFTGLGAVAYASQAKTIVQHTTIAGQNVGGLDALAAIHQVEQRWNSFTGQALAFSAGDQKFTIPTLGSSDANDQVINDLIQLDIVTAVNRAYDFGHRGSWLTQVRQRFSGWLGREHRFGRVAIDSKSLSEELRQHLTSQEKPAVDAGLSIAKDTTITITPSTPGQSFNYTSALNQARLRVSRLDPAPITVTAIVVDPDVPDSPGLREIASQQYPSVAARAPLTVTSGDKTWTINYDQLVSLLGWQRQGEDFIVSLDEAKTTAWLNTIKKDVETQPQNAKFAILDGKVKEFQASAIGRVIDIAATIAKMRDDIVVSKSKTTSLVVIETKPITDTNTTNNLGITELVAEGATNFHGSPTNRRFNLTFGSQKLNGLLIAPGETFSLVTALGKIDGAHGWKSELVIKGTDIKPEFGGGLCQVGTTLFRAVLNAGLPVVERHNHSLRIRYYEPPIGLDATIYEPKPDLRFTNDYPSYLLLQTKVEGNDLTYSFYGTKDGRTADIPTPRVYNRTAIPPTKNIEVDDLKPGETKCQAPGHPGADATATYTVTKADGTKVVQVFQSHYRPLPVICHIGKKKPVVVSPVINTNTNTNTNADMVVTNS